MPPASPSRFDATGRTVAVIVALGVADSFDMRPEGANARALRLGAAAVSQRLGYVRPDAA